jgi:rhamnosyltransferase
MKILVILASYNGAKYIYDQINSILLQKNLFVDIFVFDDVSTDSTIEVVKKISNPNVRLFVNETSSGSAANNFCNSILSISDETFLNYDFVALADQDDIWHIDKLKSAVDKLECEGSSLYASNLILWEQNTGKKSKIKKDFPQKKFDFLFEGCSAGCTYLFSSYFAISLKNNLSNINYLNWSFFSHDWFIYFFARFNNFKVVIDKDAFILYRVHDSNVHGQLNVFSISSVFERIKLIKNGWYIKQVENFITLLPPNSEEYYIYKLYNKSYLGRVYILFRYNFSLMRSKKKFFYFLILSLIPINRDIS